MKLGNLEESTRVKMQKEVERAVAAGRLHLSERLTREGREQYAALLRQAVASGTPKSFARALRSHLRSYYDTKSGTRRKVPSNAAELLANGEFNHFYVRGMCIRAIEEKRGLVVFRAQEVSNPRPKSEELLGSSPDPEELLADLRNGLSYENGMNIPGGPGSKISVRFKEESDDQ